MLNQKFQCCLTAIILTSAGFAGSALAQDAGSDEAGRLEEITVTARRFDESLQQAPVSVTAMTAEFLAAQRMQDVTQVIEMTPGATFTVFSKGQMDYSMRGISSQGEGAAADSAVITVVDNVVIGKDMMKVIKFWDVEQIEVLRGPQGTAFGRNAAAGAVHIINKRPSRDFESYFEATAGNFNLLEVNGVVNGAIGESGAGRLSVHYDDRDGYTTDLGTGNAVDDSTNLSIRGQLMFDLGDSVEILLKGLFSTDSDGNISRRSRDCTQAYLEPPFGDYTDPCDPWTTHTSLEIDGPFDFDRDISLVSATINWDIADDLSLTSVTAYVDGDVVADVDNFGTPVNVVYNLISDDASQFTQEFRLDNSASAARTKWLIGAYYLTDDHTRVEDREILSHLPFSSLQGSTTTNKTDSYALFGQLDFSIGDRASLTVGGRYSNDKKDFDVFHRAEGALADIFIENPADSPIVASTSDDWSEFTGSVSLSYDIGESSMIYGLVSQGYKAGGFNGEPASVEAALTPYDPENSLNIEAGAKMDLSDDRVRLNLTVFDLTYDDLQVGGNLPSGTPIIENASGADVFGVEAELTWLATDNFSLMGSYANLDGELRGSVAGDDVEGNQPPNAPEWTAKLAARLDFPLGNGSNIGLRADWRGRSDVFVGATNDNTRPGVDIYGAAVFWDSPDEQWNVTVWGRNLGDEAEIVSVGPGAIVSQNPTAFGPPRTYGLTLRYNVQ